MLTSWLQWLKGLPGRTGRIQHYRPRRRTVTSRRSFVPRLDVLEDRTVPSGLQDVLHIGAQGSLSDRPDATVKRIDAATGAYYGPLAAAGSDGQNSPHALDTGNPGNDNRAPDLGAYPKLQV